MNRAGWFAAAALLCAPGSAAAEWGVIASNEAMVVEFDPDLVRTQGEFAMAWTRMTFTSPRPVETRPELQQQSQLQLHAVDCAAGASTVVAVTLHAGPFGRGEAIDRTLRPRAEWSPRPAPPGSLAAATIRLACDELARRPAR
jgi:hypothetical protein